jgi:hypothetical protein
MLSEGWIQNADDGESDDSECITKHQGLIRIGIKREATRWMDLGSRQNMSPNAPTRSACEQSA